MNAHSVFAASASAKPNGATGLVILLWNINALRGTRDPFLCFLRLFAAIPDSVWSYGQVSSPFSGVPTAAASQARQRSTAS